MYFNIPELLTDVLTSLSISLVFCTAELIDKIFHDTIFKK